MDFEIRGKLALVTAASGGMGRNIAHALAAEGANIALFARTEDKLHAVASEIKQQHGVSAFPVCGSMLETADVERLADYIAGLGGLDILVLVTGRPPNPLRPTLEETEEARWMLAYQNQLWSVINTTTRLLPTMLGRGWGRVIAITSASAKQPMADHALSTVFRAGVTAYMKGLASEVGPAGVTVNCVAPALIDTSHRTGKAAYSPEQTARRMKLTPLARMGTQDELCSAVTYLASGPAGFITGSTMAVEGGMIGSLF